MNITKIIKQKRKIKLSNNSILGTKFYKRRIILYHSVLQKEFIKLFKKLQKERDEYYW